MCPDWNQPGNMLVKKLALAFLITTALITPAAAANATIEVGLNAYRGPNAYLAVYLVDAAARYDSTLWVAGRKFKYLKHLRGWARGFSAAGDRLDGITGASVGGGQTLRINADLSDALIDAGYRVVVDTSVENWGDYTSDASVGLTSGGASASGSGFVNRLAVSF